MTPTIMTDKATDPLITALERRGVLGTEQVEELRAASFESSAELEEVLTETHSVTETEILLALAEHARVPVISLDSYQFEAELIVEFPRDMLMRNRAVPVARTASCLTLAIADPLNLMAVEEVGEYCGLQVIPVATPEQQILEALQSADPSSREALDDILKQANESGDVELSKDMDAGNLDIDGDVDSGDEAPVIRIVNMVLVEAMRRHASDVHIEPFEREVQLRYRVDGVLQEAPAPPKNLQNAITSRLKVMADLDIAERRIPQDGRFRIKAQGREVDLRVSILPTVHGEKIVLRLLDKSNLAKDLESIGLDTDSLGKLRHAIRQPHGMILVTGPTGSGKTTTLYSALQELNTPDVNIVTVENPVEYQLHGINQVAINSQTGLTFAASLRSILRQDPDIVLVGETRDRETASIAVEAALTGHLVMSTLHTNDAPGAIARLVQMGVEPFLLASSLLLTQAQRLVRRICPVCKEVFDLTEEYCRSNGIPTDLFDGQDVYHGKGCSRCNYTGYKGRASIMEVLLITPEIRDLILKSANADEIRNHALQNGFRELRESGFRRVLEGTTTLEEVLRVTAGEV